MAELIIYEHPLNERIRTLLRLERLFDEIAYHMTQSDPWNTRQCVKALLDATTALTRGDLRSELLKEVERLTNVLRGIQRDAGIDTGMLDETLAKLEQGGANLRNQSGQIGQRLRNDEFLKTVAQRSCIPGGDCSFDLPELHYWLHRPEDERRADLSGWLTDLAPVRHATDLLLSLIRDSAISEPKQATRGMFQQDQDADRGTRLIRIGLDPAIPCHAEVSGGKHRYTIRFIDMSRGLSHPAPADYDIEFSLTNCML